MSVTADVSPKRIEFNDPDGGFSLTATGVTVSGNPAFGSWESALDLAVYMEQRSPFWKADLLVYANKRPDWGGFIDAVIDAGTFTESTVQQYRSVAKRVPAENRVEGLSFSHHEKVASLPVEDQRKYLDKAKAEHLSVSALDRVVKKARKVKRVLSGQATELAKAYDAVVEAAHEAAEFCREIPAHDAKDAERKIGRAIAALSKCDTALVKLRKAQGKKP